MKEGMIIEESRGSEHCPTHNAAQHVTDVTENKSLHLAVSVRMSADAERHTARVEYMTSSTPQTRMVERK
jgi:hypothetical protein